MASKVMVVVSVIVLIYIISTLLSSAIDLDASDKIAIIPITGIITPTETTFTFQQRTTTPSTIIEFLKTAEANSRVKGIILEINSPGGTVVASKEIADAVKQSSKPVTALIKDLGTSGAYWIASAADIIVADPLSITGSIGVTSSYLEFSKLFEEYGVTYESLTAGKYKDIGSPYKELTQEERTIIQKKLGKIHEAFIKEIAANRKIPEEDVRALATGVYYLGEEAKELGLVDYLGNKDLAVSLTKEASSIKEANLITYKKERTILDILSSLSMSSFYSFGVGMGEAKLHELQQAVPHA